jgi:hypothetical protein
MSSKLANPPDKNTSHATTRKAYLEAYLISTSFDNSIGIPPVLLQNYLFFAKKIFAPYSIIV